MQLHAYWVNLPSLGSPVVSGKIRTAVPEEAPRDARSMHTKLSTVTDSRKQVLEESCAIWDKMARLKMLCILQNR